MELLGRRIRQRVGCWGVRPLRLALALEDLSGNAMMTVEQCICGLRRLGLGPVSVQDVARLLTSAGVSPAIPFRPPPSRPPPSELVSAMYQTTGRRFNSSVEHAAQQQQQNKKAAASTSTIDCGHDWSARDVVCLNDVVDAAAAFGDMDDCSASSGATPPRRRLQAICACFDELLKRVGGSHQRLTVEFLCSEVDVRSIPDVHHGVVSLRDALLCFFSMWGAPLHFVVSQELFVQFFSDWSCVFTTDVEFVDSFLCGIWGMRGGSLSADNEPVPSLAPTREESDKLFASIDVNGNGVLSLAELDLAVVRKWPRLNTKAAIMRAYKLADKNLNGLLDRSEFFLFCQYVIAYASLMKKFKEIDVDRSGSISLEELRAGKKLLGLEGESDVSLRRIFKEIDVNGGGKILFEEFCVYMAKRCGMNALRRVTNKF